MKRASGMALAAVATIGLSLGPLLLMGGNTSAKTIATRRSIATKRTTNLSWFTDVDWWSVPGWKANTSAPVFRALTDKFGLTFTTDVPPIDADAKLSLMLTTGNIPNLITLETASEVKQLVQSGRVWNLNQFFKKYDPSFLKEPYPTGLGVNAIEQQDHDFGGFYGIPNFDSAPDMFSSGKTASTKAQVLYGSNAQIEFNVPLMKKAGITLAQVRTAAGLDAALKKVAAMHLKVAGQPVIPLQVDTNTNWPSETLDSLAQMFGAMPVTKSGNYRPLRLSPEMKTTIDYLHTLATQGVLTPDEFTLDTSSVESTVQSDRVFAFLGNTGNPHWARMYDQNHSETVESPGNILSPTGLTPTWGYTYMTDWTYTLVSKTTPDPAALAKALAYMWSPPGQLLLNYGIEGPDWHWGSTGRVVQNPTIKKDEATDSSYWLKTGLTEIWFFTDYPYLLTIEPDSNVMPTSEENAMKLKRALIKPVHLYNATAVSMPPTLIPAGSTLANDQTQINDYWDEQVLKMIFASSTSAEDALYRQTIPEMMKMGLTQIDNVTNKEFHQQEREDHYTLKGINP